MKFDEIFAHQTRLLQQLQKEKAERESEAEARRAARKQRKEKEVLHEQQQSNVEDKAAASRKQQQQMNEQAQQPQNQSHVVQQQQQPPQQQQQPDQVPAQPMMATETKEPLIDLVHLAAQSVQQERAALLNQVQKQPEQARQPNEQQQMMPMFMEGEDDGGEKPDQAAANDAAVAAAAAAAAAIDEQRRNQEEEDAALLAALRRPYLLAWDRHLLQELVYGCRFSSDPVYVLPVSASVAFNGIQCDSALAVHSSAARIVILCGTGSVILSPVINEQTQEEVAVVVGQLLLSASHRRHGIFTFRIADFMRQAMAAIGSDFLISLPYDDDDSGSPVFDISIAMTLLQASGFHRRASNAQTEEGEDAQQQQQQAQNRRKSEQAQLLDTLAPLSLPSIVRNLFPAQVIKQRVVAVNNTSADDGDAAAAAGEKALTKRQQAAAKRAAAAEAAEEQQRRKQQQQGADNAVALLENPWQFEERLVEHEIFFACMAEARAIFSSHPDSEPALRAGAVASLDLRSFPAVEAAFFLRAAADRVMGMLCSAELQHAVRLNTGSEIGCALMEHHGFCVRRQTLQQIEGNLMARGEYLDRKSQEAAVSLELFVAAFSAPSSGGAAPALDGQQQQQPELQQEQQPTDSDDAAAAVLAKTTAAALRRDFWRQHQQQQQPAFTVRAIGLPQLYQKVVAPALAACSAASERMRALAVDATRAEAAVVSPSPLFGAVLKCVSESSAAGGDRQTVALISQSSALQAGALRILGFSPGESAVEPEGRRQQRRDDEEEGSSAANEHPLSENELLQQQLDAASCLVFVLCRAAMELNSLFYEMRPCKGLREALVGLRKPRSAVEEERPFLVAAAATSADGGEQAQQGNETNEQHQQRQQQHEVYSDLAEIHTHFTGIRSDTGRIFSSGPNLQVLPRASKSQLRRVLVAPPGAVLVSFDYSQFELRVLAHMSGDSQLIAALSAEGRDVLAEITADVLGVRLPQHEQAQQPLQPVSQQQQDEEEEEPVAKRGIKKDGAAAAAAVASAAMAASPDSVDNNNNNNNNNNNAAPAFMQPGTPAFAAARDAVKIMVYGLLFGMGDVAVADQVNSIIREFAASATADVAAEAQRWIKEKLFGGANNNNNNNNSYGRQQPTTVRQLFFDRFPGVRRWMDDVTSRARVHRRVRTLSGMTRDLTSEVEAASRSVRGPANPTGVVSRQAVATAVQGTAADILKVALCSTQRCRGQTTEERRQDLASGAGRTGAFRPFALLLAIHDELVFALDARSTDRMERVIAELAAAMRSAGDVLVRRVTNNDNARFAVPLEVKVKRGWNFGEQQQVMGN